MRRSRHTRKKNNPLLQLAQVIGLAIMLIMILLFRDKISIVAGSVLGSFESEDLKKEPKNTNNVKDLSKEN